MLRSLLCAGLFLSAAVIAVGAPPVIPPATGDPPPVRVDAPKTKSAAPDLDIPAEVRPSGQYAQFVPKTNAVAVTYVGLDGVDPVPAVLLRDPRVFLLDVRGLKDGRYRFVAVAAGKTGEQTRADFAVTVGKVEPKPDDPVPPPKPDDPTPPPGPVTSFEVILVYESGATHTAGQKAVLEGRVVEEWLTANCTGGRAGWQRRDKDSDPAADTTPLREMWAAAKPRLPAVPCVAIAVNKVVRFEPLPATPAELVRVLTKYREGK